jgi:hypothetical protein
MDIQTILGLGVLGLIIFVVVYYFFSGGDGGLLGTSVKLSSDALKAISRTADLTAKVVNQRLDFAEEVVTNPSGSVSTSVLSAGSLLTGSAMACGSKRNRGTKSDEPEGTACSWLSDGKTCYLHTRNGVWKCDESCANSKACCKKWWKDGVCTNTG